MQAGQAPLPAEDASFLHPTSVAGRQIDFVNQSNTGHGGLNLAAAGDGSNGDFGSFTISFSYILGGATYPWTSVVAWNYANFLVDFVAGYEDYNMYRLGTNVSGTSAALRKTMNIDIFSTTQIVLPVLLDQSVSSRIYYYCQNKDTSTHTIDIYTLWKYIVTGGPNG